MADEGVQPRAFTIEHHPRRDFFKWVREQFPELEKYDSMRKEYPDLVRRIHEVHGAAITVLSLTKECSGEAIKEYYQGDLEKLNSAYQAKDVVAYASNLELFLGGIEWE